MDHIIKYLPHGVAVIAIIILARRLSSFGFMFRFDRQPRRKRQRPK